MFGISLVKNKDIQILREELSLYQRQLEDIGWLNLSIDQTSSQDEIFGQSFKNMVKQCRLYFYKSPLAGQWVNLTTAFIFGEGISTPKCKDKNIQEAINDFWVDPDNQKCLTSITAQQMLSNKLQVEGNLFFVLFDDDRGDVRVRVLNTDEVSDIILDSEDRLRPNFYKVASYNKKFNFSSGTYDMGSPNHVYYPDIDIFDMGRFAVPKGKLKDEARIFHVKINCDINDKYGVPELYRGIDWIKAHKTMSEDIATLVKALSQFAWKKKIKGTSAQVSSIAAAMQSKMSLNNIKNSVGQTQVENEGIDLQSIDIKTGGVQIGVDASRQMKLMVCAASGIFEHYFGDPSTGNLATSKSMELPMIKKFTNYQSVWTSIYERILNYVVEKKISVGLLSGREVRDEKFKRIRYETDLDRAIDIDFPPILEADLKEWSESMSLAKSRGLIPKETAAQLFMLAANVNNIEDEIDKLKKSGEFDKKEPEQPIGGPGQMPFESVSEAIESPSKKLAIRMAKKENYVMQRMNGYRKQIAGNFKELVKEVKNNAKASGEKGRIVGNVPDFGESLNKFIENMRESAKEYFPIAVEIGEKFMQANLRDVKPGIKIEETLYEAQGKSNDILRKRLSWNDDYLESKLKPAMMMAMTETIRKSYDDEPEFNKAVSDSLFKFESRLELYTGAFWTVEEEAVKEAGRGTEVMVNFVGPDDDHTCSGCDESVTGNPWPINDAPLPGEQDCMGRCRHALQIIVD
jgi:hypothetical protein